VSQDRLALILTPIDTEAYCPQDRHAACLRAGLDPQKRFLLFMGRLEDPVKRVSAIIRAFAKVAPGYPEADIVIAGDGPDADALRNLAAELAPDRVHFEGWVSDVSQRSALYNASECLLLASSREGFPTVVGEAMACGTPVLSSNVGGVSELVVEGETGWLFPAYDDAALEAGILQVLSFPELVRAMGPRVRSRAEARLSPATVAKALRECFSIGGGRHACS
jgi:glycosyltransferase involved in cell wall biosynthesis